MTPGPGKPQDPHQTPLVDKRAVRETVRERLAAMTDAQRADASNALVTHAIASPAYAAARSVLLFAPMPGEPDVGPLIEHALERGKAVLLPRTRWAERAMDAAVVTRPTAHTSWKAGLAEVRPGLFQPPDDAPTVSPSEIDLVFVPGVAFDDRGGRLGRGAGFYDRFLGGRGRTAPFLGAQSPAGRWCGVAFACQLVGRVPTEPHDQPVTDLLTESGWRTVRTDR